MEFSKIECDLERSNLVSSFEALTEISSKEVGIGTGFVQSDEFLRTLIDISRKSPIEKQVLEAIEAINNLKERPKERINSYQFEAGANGLDFIIVIGESGSLFGCIRTGVILDA